MDGAGDGGADRAADRAADVVVLRGRPDEAELAALLAVLAVLRTEERHPREDLLPPPAPPWTRPTRYRAAGSWSTR